MGSFSLQKAATLWAVALTTCAGSALLTPAVAQTGPGWTTLIDNTKMGDWNRIGNANWRLSDGAVVVDKKTDKAAAYLVSKAPQKNFQMHIEFWSSADANSGLFFRCANPKNISAKTCYEANIFDTRKDQTYGTGAIVDFAEVNPMPKAGGKWNTMEVTANGRQLVVVFKAVCV